MKKNTSYVMTFLFGAFFGAFVMFNFWQPNIQPKTNEKNADLKIQRFDKNFDSRDITKRKRSKLDRGDQMNKDIDDLKDQMQRAFKDTGSIFKMMENTIQDATLDSMGVRVGEITEKITKDSIILEMDITNIDNSSMNIDVKNNKISISGEARIENKEESGGSSSSSVMVSSFSRVVPVPEGTRASGLRLEYKDQNTLQMIFPKVK